MTLKFKQFKWADEEFEECQVIEGTPRIYITPDGKHELPSMTSILAVLDDGGIDAWRKRVGEEEADRITNAAVDRGNALHDYNEKYLKNILKRTELEGPSRILFNRIKPHLDKIDLVIATEAPLYNVDDQYAGRVDCIALVGNEINIVDHKNSRNPINLNTRWGRRKLMKYQLQCTGYARALYKMKGYQATTGRLIVGNHLTSSSDCIAFDIEPFQEELDIVIDAYHNDLDGKKGIIKKSLFFQI